MIIDKFNSVNIDNKQKKPGPIMNPGLEVGALSN